MIDNTVFEVIDPYFENLIAPKAKLRKLSEDHLWTEGPVWFDDRNALLFSDIPNRKIHQWAPDGTVTVFRAESGFSNGHTRDLQGRMVSCQHGTRSVTRTELDGQISVLADGYNDKPLNSPNDVVVRSDGSIWFTDPTYGIKSNYEGYEAPQEQTGRFVFRLVPETGDLNVVVSDFSQPNGLAFSCDEERLYITDSGQSDDPDFPAIVRKFDVKHDGSLSDDGVFATMDPGIPDGLRVDEHDNVWISAADGVHCVTRDGILLGKIKVPETVSNLTFGGASGTELFITATTSVYAINVSVRSAMTVTRGQ